MPTISVKIVRPDRPMPPGKLADAELHFHGGDLDGLRLVGFAVWQRRDGHGCNVSFPSRPFTVRGDRRSYALLRPTADPNASTRISDLILEAFATSTHDIRANEPIAGEPSEHASA